MSFGNSSYQIHTAEYGYPITPNDTFTTAGFPVPWKYLWVGGAGNVSLIDMGGNVVTLIGVAAGTQILMAGKQVRATLTTATNLVAMV